LTFLDKKNLLKHKRLHHNPLERLKDGHTIQPFIVTRSEEHFCVQAMPMELFIPNKQPNIAIEEASHRAVVRTSKITEKNAGKTTGKSTISVNESTGEDDDDDDDEEEDDGNDKGFNETNSNNQDKRKKKLKKSDESKSQQAQNSVASRFLAGGQASIRVNPKKSSTLTTEEIIHLMSNFKRADCIIPNQSVILHPNGGPIKCLDCGEHITVDHLVSAIQCKPCKFTTHCPRALKKHKLKYHPDK